MSSPLERLIEAAPPLRNTYVVDATAQGAHEAALYNFRQLPARYETQYLVKDMGDGPVPQLRVYVAVLAVILGLLIVGHAMYTTPSVRTLVATCVFPVVAAWACMRNLDDRPREGDMVPIIAGCAFAVHAAMMFVWTRPGKLGVVLPSLAMSAGLVALAVIPWRPRYVEMSRIAGLGEQ